MRRFGVGQPVRRSEDRRFLTGSGRYTADISLPGQAYGAVLRSPHAHAQVLGIDVTAALALPGVLAVVTATDLAADGLAAIRCTVPIKGPVGQPMPRPGRPLLARDRVRFVGEPVAFVVAETRAVARDALEVVEVSYEPLPAVADIDEALRGDSGGRIWDGAIDNIAFFWEHGDETNGERGATPHRRGSSPCGSSITASFPARWSPGQRSVTTVAATAASPSTPPARAATRSSSSSPAIP